MILFGPEMFQAVHHRDYSPLRAADRLTLFVTATHVLHAQRFSRLDTLHLVEITTKIAAYNTYREHDRVIKSVRDNSTA